MIHEVKAEHFKLNLDEYELTFDDALFSQYYYAPLLRKINTRKILFISTGLIQMEHNIRTEFRGHHIQFPTCYDAMDLWKTSRNNVHYMTINEIKNLIHYGGFEIGAHSHMHIRNYPKRISELVNAYKEDTELMLEWFQKNLNIKPNTYCFPYNKEYILMRKLLTDTYDFKYFYGNERIDIEELI